jgi:hypothetical protein
MAANDPWLAEFSEKVVGNLARVGEFYVRWVGAHIAKNCVNVTRDDSLYDTDSDTVKPFV